MLTWIDGEYKKHRQDILLDRERSRLPAAQLIIERIKESKTMMPELDILRKEKDAAYKIYIDAARKWAALDTQIQNLGRGLPPTDEPSDKKEEKRVFVMPCPASACRGFLSTAYKCGVCDVYTCPDCREIKGLSKDAPHTCDPKTVETVAALKKECRNCPECGTNIFRISGCFTKNTQILLWNGETKNSQDIIIGDILVGDDGEKRIVENITSGNDKLYKVSQSNGESYIVNSKHILALKYIGDKSIYWNNKTNIFTLGWFNRETKHHQIKKFKVKPNEDKNIVKANIDIFIKENINTNDVIEISVEDYIAVDKWTKQRLVGFKTNSGINWPSQHIEMDPYLLGLWLGDGTHSLPDIASNDIEIQKYILDWCNNNDAELIHDEGIKFRIRRNNSSNGKDEQRTAIGNGSTSDNCKGCTYKKQEICNIINNTNINTNISSKSNPFMNSINKYNLFKNKHIPKEYLQNTRDVRLKLLAGIIDTDGHVPKNQNGKRVIITQSNEKLSQDIIILAKSLGFIVNVTKYECKNKVIFNIPAKDYKDKYCINISGDKLEEIPTLLPRKKCVNSNSNKDYFKTSICVTEAGYGEYYGWSVNSNKRFLHKDFTVLRNCSQMFCTQCHTGFDWNTGKKMTNGVIHNPHYFDYIKQLNGGVMPRGPGDIPCGNNLPSPWELDRVLRTLASDKVTTTHRNIIYQGLNTFNHMLGWEIPNNTNRVEDTDNTEYNLRYLRNEITEMKWKQILQQREKRRMRRDEIRQRLEAFCGAASDVYGQYIQRMRAIAANTNHDNKIVEVVKQWISETENTSKVIVQLREMMNEELMKLSYRYRCQMLWIKEDMTYERKRAPRTKDDDDADDEDDDEEGEKKPKNKVVKKTKPNSTESKPPTN
jgi:intein/homing endonuclease